MTPHARPALRRCSPSASAPDERHRRSPTPATRGPSASLAEIARDADLFVCEATLLAPNPEGGPRGHLSAVEALEASEAGGAKRLLLTHRPYELPLENGFELARDGLEITISL